jgi:hypothetical protein
VTHRAKRAGFAAAVALSMLAALAALAADSFYTVVESRRSAVRLARAESASSAADAGLRWALERWNVARRDSLPIGAADSAGPIPWLDSDSAGTQVRVIHLTPPLFWVESVAQAGAGTAAEAVRSYRVLVAVSRPVFPMLAAVVARGPVQPGPETIITGEDTAPPGWSDCPAGDGRSVPGVLAPPGPVPDSTALERFGPVTAASLAASADVVIAGGSMVAPSPDFEHACGTGPSGRIESSWGDPYHIGRSPGCESFFPIVYAAGALTVTGGRGQGVLIVDGRLSLRGPFLFAGVVLARGGIETVGQGVDISGLVLSPSGAVAMLTAAGTIRRSACAVARASEGARRPLPERAGGWAGLF